MKNKTVETQLDNEVDQIENAASVMLNDTCARVDTIASTFLSIETSDMPTLDSEPSYLDALTYVKELKKIKNRWESELYRASNDSLYIILAECYRLLLNPEIYNPESSVRRCIEDECKKGMKKMQKNTTIEAKIVRVIFGDMYNRRRVHSYSVVLQEAKKQKITADSLPDWIRLYGGVEEIRLNSKPKVYVSIPPTSKKKLSKEQLQEIADQKEEQRKQAEAAFDRLIDTGVCEYDDVVEKSSGDSDQSNLQSDAGNTSEVSSCEVSSSASSKDECGFSADANASSSDSTAGDDLQVDLDVFDCLKNKVVDLNQERVCIAFKRNDGTYDIKWELEDEAVKRLAIAAYRMERHGVFSEYDQVRSDLFGETQSAALH